jgi:alkylation response protein AidB-like acyl-CoA dehydrogenase
VLREPHPVQEPHEFIKCLAGHGLMGMTVPEKYGGGGRDDVSHVLTLMEISKGSASAGGVLVWNNSLYCFSILRYGKEEQKRKYLSLCVSGEKPGCFVLAGNGTPGDVRTSVVANGQDWRIHGEGSFFPCGMTYGIAAAFSHDGISVTFIIIDLENSEGLRRGEIFERGGIFFSGIAETLFENVRVSAEAILCSGDDVPNPIQCTLRESWLGVGALAAGIGQGTLEEVLDFARAKQGSGKVSQVTEWKLADMGVELEASELLVLKAAWLKDHHKNFEKEAAGAKAFAAEAAVKASFEGLQILGNRDPRRRISMQKRMRDAERCQIYYSTREQLGFVVADHLGRGRITES